MKISFEESERRLNSPKNIANLRPSSEDVFERVDRSERSERVEHRNSKISREKSPNVPEPIRDTIGTLAFMPGVKGVNLAKEFNVSTSAVSQYKNGRIGGLPPTHERKQKVQDRIENIKDQALEKLMAVLGLLGPDKLLNLDANDLGRLGNSMANVVKSLDSRESVLNLNAPSIVIYSPESRNEEKYKVVDI